jgi:hypothetical protein
VIEPGQTIIVYKVADKARSDRAAKQWKKSPAAQKPKPVAPAKAAPQVRTADRVPGPVTSPSDLEGDAEHP